MNKKITAIIIAACVAIFSFFLGGAFLIYNSFIKMQELQAKVKIEQEKTKQEMLKTQNDQQMAQVTTSQETSVPVVTKKSTNYEVELMSRMSSVPENNMVNADEVFTAWDKELNKVYKLLMSELPESQKTKLRNEERAWLKRKDKEMDRAAEEMAAGKDDESQTTEGGTLWEYYMFKKCVINGRTYYGTASQDNGSRAALRVYFNDFSQRSYISDLIENSRRINLKSGVTAVDEGEGNWGINVNKIEIK